MASIADLRAEYRQGRLSEASSAADPFAQFDAWFEEARRAEVPEPNAMTLATASPDGRPSARIVLLKAVDDASAGARGFVFYTNYESRKADELLGHPFAALVFWWEPLERQIRIEGRAQKVAAAESDAYFEIRPRGSRLGAWASDQSRPIADREALEARLTAAEHRFPNDVPRPAHWGGFRVVPDRIEFWQGGEKRLHDRLVYTPDGDRWARERLQP
jgi:pyridoxamine 5'-phosphate oxidase